MRPIFLAALFLGASSPLCLRAETPGLQIIGFSDNLRLRVDGRSVDLEAGSAGYTIPAGARATVIAGDAVLLAEGAVLNVDSGDSILYIVTDGPGQLLVQSGEVSITPPGGAAYTVAAGEFAPLSGSLVLIPPQPPAAVPEPAPRPAPVAAPQPPPAAAQEKPSFDALDALASGLGKLAKFTTPKLSLVVEIRPFYRFSQAYDSNIYLVPQDQANGVRTGGGVRSSWITTNNLGARFALPLSKRSKLTAIYDAQAINYSTQGKANDAVNQNIRAGFSHAARRGSSLKLWTHYLNTEDPAFSELVARERRFQNSSGFEFDYTRSRRLFIRPRASHTIHKYLSSTLGASLNRFEADFGADIGLRVQPKTRLFGSYSRKLIHYSAGRLAHSKSHIAGLGAEGQLAPRLTGRVSGELTMRRYDIPLTVGAREINTFTTAIDLTYKPGRRFESRFVLSRAVTETTFALNRFYVANRAAFGFTHFFRKLSLSLDGSIQIDQFPETTTVAGISRNRRDDIYNGTVKADYKMRPWLTTGLSYTRTQRHSIFYDQFSYTVDKTAFTVEMTF